MLVMSELEKNVISIVFFYGKLSTFPKNKGFTKCSHQWITLYILAGWHFKSAFTRLIVFLAAKEQKSFLFQMRERC